MPTDIAAIRALSEKPLGTRWQPVDVLCAGEITVRTKLVRDADTAAVCVSEAVSHEVLRLIGLRVADCHAVIVGVEFALDMTRQYGFAPPVMAGRHWGTTFLGKSALEVELTAAHGRLLKTPAHLLTLHLADVLLANPDRSTHGNVLLVTEERGRLALLPIDQSDCFNHPGCFRVPERLAAARNQRIGGWLPGTELVVMRQPPGFVAAEIARIMALSGAISDAVNIVPEEWYSRAGIDPDGVRDFLAWRLANLPTLVDMSYWENLANATGGGHVLEF